MSEPKKILIIEDEQALALAYQRKFSQAGYQVEVTADGQTGVTIAKEKKPHLVILDIMLPGKMNGFDVLRILQLSPDTKNIPVIVMSNLAEEGKSALELGAKEFLVKVNVSLQDLLEKAKFYLNA